MTPEYDETARRGDDMQQYFMQCPIYRINQHSSNTDPIYPA